MRFRFNEKKTAQAAAHLLKRSGGKMPYMVLIKLLFLSDRKALVDGGKPITGATMVSMKHGPVLSEVLDLINEGQKKEGAWSRHVSTPDSFDVQLKEAEPENDELSLYELDVLDEVHAQFGHMDRWALVDWLHANIPEWSDPGGSSQRISFADVLRANDVPEKTIQDVRRGAEFSWAIGALRQ